MTVLGKNKLKLTYFLTTFFIRQSSHIPSVKRERGVNFKMARKILNCEPWWHSHSIASLGVRCSKNNQAVFSICES